MTPKELAAQLALKRAGYFCALGVITCCPVRSLLLHPLADYHHRFQYRCADDAIHGTVNCAAHNVFRQPSRSA